MAKSLYSITRSIYGPPMQVQVDSLKNVNTFRLQLLKEYQEGDNRAIMTLLKAEYHIGDKVLNDLLGFIAKALESNMKNHKYFSKRTPEEDDLQDVVVLVLSATKSIKLETIENEEAIGNYLTSLIRYVIKNVLRNKLRQENRGLAKDKWADVQYIDESLDETYEIETSVMPKSPEEMYEMALEETMYEKLIQDLGTKRQQETAKLFLENKTYKEIANAMGISEGTAKGNIALLKAKLAAYGANN